MQRSTQHYDDLIGEFCYPLVTRLTTRAVVGPEFDDDTELHSLFIDYNKMAESLMGVALLVPKIFWGLIRGPAKKQDQVLAEHLLPEILRRRENRKKEEERDASEENQPRVDLLQDLIEEGIEDESILTTVKVLMWASVMNTSSALQHVLYDVFSRKDLAARLVAEIGDAYEKSDPPTPTTFDSVGKLALLDACVRESLRMGAAPFGAARGVFKDVPINKNKKQHAGQADHAQKTTQPTTIPKDQIVLISRYLIHHDPDQWDRPDEYWPDRFLLGKKGKRIGSYNFIPFGGSIELLS